MKFFNYNCSLNFTCRPFTISQPGVYTILALIISCAFTLKVEFTIVVIVAFALERHIIFSNDESLEFHCECAILNFDFPSICGCH